jgi:hypothetical protein
LGRRVPGRVVGGSQSDPYMRHCPQLTADTMDQNAAKC